MIITCLNCGTSYHLDQTLLAPGGSRVRCSNCGEMFTAYPPPPTEALAPSEADGTETTTYAGNGPKPSEAAAAEAGQMDTVEVESGADAASAIDFDAQVAADAAPGESEGQDDFELGLDLGSETKEEAAQIGDAAEQDLDLELDLGEALADVEAEAAAEPMDDLDLDLELDLGEAPAEARDEESVAEPKGDLDLDLELDLGEAPAEAEKEEVAAEAMGDLDLDLELDLGEAPAEAEKEEVAAEAMGDLDLDLELDLDEAPAEPGTLEQAETSEEFEIDLGLDLEDGGEKSGPDETAVGGEEFDLKELEAALDIEEPARDEALEDLDLELDLDLDMEGAKAESGEKISGAETPDQEEELDLTDIEEMLKTGEGLDLIKPEPAAKRAPEKPALPEVDEAVDLGMVPTHELEQGAALFEETQEDTGVDEEIAAYAQTYELGQVPDELGDEGADVKTAPAKTKPKTRKGTGKPLILLLVLVLLGGGVYGAHLMGIQIPFLSDMLAPQVKDELGNLKISTFQIDSRFVDNAQLGRLFVITGKVRNDYPQPHSFIQVRGKLFQKGKKLVATQVVSCGNVLADLDLTRLPLEEIKTRLNNRAGANKSNLNVAPGGVVPFMVVFPNLPADLEEFTIEVAGSQ